MNRFMRNPPVDRLVRSSGHPLNLREIADAFVSIEEFVCCRCEKFTEI
jgi:hypothetical protein